MSISQYTLYENDLPTDIEFSDCIAIDTETMGLDYRRDRLCLVQISNGDDHAHLIQIKEKTSYPALAKVLKNKNIKKIFHYARFDLAAIQKNMGIYCENIYCTKIASKLVRTYTDKHGLKELIKEFVGIDISKQYQSSDFGGELSQAQLKYCANDVLYLHKINKSLNQILMRENRMKLYENTINFIQTRVELDLASFKEDIWAH